MAHRSTDQLEIQSLARDFAAGEVRSGTALWDEARAIDDEIFEKLGELGFLGMLIPEEFGGLGFDVATYLMVLEELSWGDASVALSVAIHSGPVSELVRKYGTAMQQERWLPKLASGSVLGGFALSEPEAGSDPESMRAEAVSGPEGWTLRGVKRWVTNGRRAGLVVVFARTEAGVSAFLVEPGTRGYDVTGSEQTLGLRASETVTVELNDVLVGGDALLGQPGEGMRYALQALDLGRAGIAAQAVGIGRAAMEHAVRYAQERRQFGQALSEFGATRAKFAEMHRRIAGARALAHHAGVCLEAHERGNHPRTGPDGTTAMAAAAKLAASEAATWVADEAVQIFGGYGYMRDYPVEKLLRDAKGTEIYEGTNEIMRHVIAREVLRAAPAGVSS